MAENVPIGEEEKYETEFAFYDITLDELKKELEHNFRNVLKARVGKFASNVVSMTKTKVTVDTALKLDDVAKHIQKLVKPEMIHMAKKQFVLIDKHMSIPRDIEIHKDGKLLNTIEMYGREKKMQQMLAEREEVFKQQAVMIIYLEKERESYEKIWLQSQIEAELLDILDQNDANSTDIASKLDELTIASQGARSIQQSTCADSIQIISDDSS